MATGISALTGNSPTPESSRVVTGDFSGGKVKSSVSNEGDKDVFKAENMGKEEFLQLLITSLQHQDPLSPTSNEDFISQMAQFSALEQSTNMATSIDKLATGLNDMITNQNAASDRILEASITSLLGKEVRIQKKEFQFNGKEADIKINIPKGESALASILDEEGKVVNTVPISNPGDQVLKWNGLQANGKTAPSGQYSIVLSSPAGDRPVGYAYEEDKVSGISYDSGKTYIHVNGEKFKYADILHISDRSE